MTAKVLPIHPDARESESKKWKRISHNLLLNQETGYYYVRKNKAGRAPLFRTTGLRKKAIAQAEADKLMAEWLGGKQSAGRRKRIEALWDELDIELEKEAQTLRDDGSPVRRKRTRDKDRTYGPIIKRYFGDTYPDEWDEQRWLAWVRTDGRRLGRQLGDIAKYMSKLLTFAYERKIIGRKPRIRNPDSKPEKPQTYSLDAIREMRLHARPELVDLITVGAETGLRPHENRELRKVWCTGSARGVVVDLPGSFTKTKIGRSIELSPAASKIVWRRVRANPESPFVFPSPSDPSRPLSDVRLSRWWKSMLKSLNEARKKAGEDPLSADNKFHHMRHTFFSHALLEAKKPLPKVAAYGGNSPKILFDRYMAKDSERTRDVAGAFKLDESE